MKISVILTTYNRPEYLREAVASYLSQDYLDSELLIVDDGGGIDGIIKQEFTKDPRITYFYKKHGGQASAINCGFNYAKGDLLVWLCDDDLFSDHESLSKRAGLFRREANTEFVATGWEIIDAQGKPTGEQYKPAPMNARQSLIGENLNLAAAMWTRNLHERLGGFNEDLKYYLDWEWKIRVALEAECLTSDIVTSRYRVHSGQAGVRRRAEKADESEQRRMRESIGERYGKIW